MNTGQFYTLTASKHLQRKIPSKCELCKNFDFHSIPNLCGRCEETLPHLHTFCRRCALPLPISSPACGNCIKQDPAYDASASAFIFQDPINTLIQRYKNHQSQTLLSTLAALFCKHMQCLETAEKQADILIPIPLHWKRQLMRGFNQSYEICKHISKHTGIPAHTKMLKRITATPHQTGLNRKQRKRNLRSAFLASPKVNNLHVILFDDVVTTGATVEAASRALKHAGARQVTVWSLARTAKKE